MDPYRNHILIKGTSSGLGLAVAIEAAKRGARVFATMRNLEKRTALDTAAKAAGVEVDVLPLDVSDIGSFEACVEAVLEAGDGRIAAEGPRSPTDCWDRRARGCAPFFLPSFAVEPG